jgi:ribosomal protein L14E/L6E/L27E
MTRSFACREIASKPVQILDKIDKEVSTAEPRVSVSGRKKTRCNVVYMNVARAIAPLSPHTMLPRGRNFHRVSKKSREMSVYGDSLSEASFFDAVIQLPGF